MTLRWFSTGFPLENIARKGVDYPLELPYNRIMQKRIFSLANKKITPVLWWISSIGLGVVLMVTPVSYADAQGNQSPRQYGSIVQQILEFIQNHYVDEVDPRTLYEGAMNGMFDALGDPHSNFLSARDMLDLNDTTSGNFGGVGLYISKPVEARDGNPPYVEVAAPMEDTPGWRAGINAGDLIIKIDGEPTDDLTMDEVLERLRGKPGTDVTTLIRRGANIEFSVTITRAVIEVPTAKYAMIGDAGYLKLLTFTPMTSERAKDALAYFREHNYKALILDLRNNYGGLLNAAIDVCNLFLDGGVVVSTKSRIPRENRVFSAQKDAAVPADMPVVVLINNASASASEIVAGALKDRGRAYLVGEKSYGKGSVQQVFPIHGSEDGYKITVARYYTPSDVNIDKIGIPPDRGVKAPEFTEEDTPNLKALVEANEIPAYVKERPNLSFAEINAYAAQLSAKYSLDAELLRILIRNEQNRMTAAPVYDLDYDVQLQEAVNILNDGSYKQLLRGTKTLRQLQDEAEMEELPAAS
ncbi:MAG: S41 family peptidase [Treponema sp.]|jgi:carboxyl-terminal processing protease|nr:S41 family peptidase [Treponema sp.]